MRTVELTAVVSEEGTVTLKVPQDIAPGAHRLILVIEEQILSDEEPAVSRSREPGHGNEDTWDVPIINVDQWPEHLSLQREDMYDDWGR